MAPDESWGLVALVVRGKMPETWTSLIPPTLEDWMAIWVVDCDYGSCKDDCAILVGKWAQADGGMGEVRHDIPQQSCWRCHRAFGVTVGHADSNGWSLGVIVGNWCIRRKVVTIGAGIGNACVMSWKRRGGFGTNSVARA